MSCNNSKKIKRENFCQNCNKSLSEKNRHSVEQFDYSVPGYRNNDYNQLNNSWGNTGPCWNTTGSCGTTKPTLTQCSNLDTQGRRPSEGLYPSEGGGDSKEYYYPSLVDNGKFNGDYATLNNTWGNQTPYNA